MKIVYIAGPYRSKWRYFKWLGRLINIWKARKMAKKVWAAGFWAICPHLNTGMLSKGIPDSIFLSGGIAMLKRSDFMLRLKGWEKSEGTLREIKVAERSNIPIIDEKEWGAFVKLFRG